jgi:hypothetical protein
MEKYTVSGILNCPNYCVLFIFYMHITNSAMGCLIQPGRLRVGDPRVRLMTVCLNETFNEVCIGKCLSDTFPIQNGLKQGDALS